MTYLFFVFCSGVDKVIELKLVFVWEIAIVEVVVYPVEVTCILGAVVTVEVVLYSVDATFMVGVSAVEVSSVETFVG